MIPKKYCKLYLVIIILILSKVFCEEKNSLTFVIDDTYSMDLVIAEVILSVNSIFDAVLKSKESQVEDFVLVTFNDYDLEFKKRFNSKLQIKTKERDEFKHALSAIKPHGGGFDCPEYALAGTMLGIKESRPRSSIYIFTDASAKDYSQYEDVKALALERQSKLIFVLTGYCGSTDSEPFEVYKILTNATSGQSIEIFGQPKNISQVIEDMISDIEGWTTDIVDTQFLNGSHTFNIPLDIQNTKPKIKVDGLFSNLSITDPNGIYTMTKTIVNLLKYSVKEIDYSTPGNYIGSFKCIIDTCHVKVTARTQVMVDYGFSTEKVSSIDYTTKSPAPDGNSYIYVKVTNGKFFILTTSIIDLEDRIVKTIPVDLLNKQNRLFGTHNAEDLPASFKLSVTGIDPNTLENITRKGQIIEKQLHPVKAPVAITPDSNTFVNYGTDLNLTCKFTAFPAPKITWENNRGKQIISQESQNKIETTSVVQIKHTKISDIYYCKAENKLGRAVSTFNVSVMSPIVVINPLKESSEEKYCEQSYSPINDPVKTSSQYKKPTEIICNIVSKYPLVIKWFYRKNSQSSEILEIHTSDKYTISSDGTTLTILSVDFNLTGSYTCEASLKYEQSQKKQFSTDVYISDLSPPKLQNTVAKQITVHNQDRATIPCKIIGGTPTPSLSWKVMRKGEHEYKPLSAFGEELTFNNASLADAGQYQCIAKNAKGQANKTTELIVIKAPEAIIDEGTAVTIPYGTTKVFKCRIVAYPLPKYAWTDSKGQKLQSKDIITDHEVISQLQVNNIKSNETYSCSADNDQGRTEARIQVSVAPAIVINEHPAVKTSSQYKKPTAIICNIVSKYPLVIKWFYRKNSQSSEILEIHTSDKYTISSDGTTLTILSVDLNLTGSYICEASLKYDQRQKKQFSTDVYISDLSPPKLQNTVAKQITVHNQLTVTIPCKIIGGTPPPSVSWKVMRKGEHEFKHLSAFGEELTFNNVSLADAGLYQCIARNAKGQADKSTELIVIKVPEAIIDEGTAVTIPYGTTKVFKCRIVAYPSPKYAWTDSKGQKLHSKDIITDHEVISQLQVNNIKSIETYSCSADNDQGRTEARIQVSVAPAIVIKEHPTVKTGVKYKVATNIYCDARSAFPIQMKWFYQKNQKYVKIEEIHTSDKYVISLDGSRLHIKSTDLDHIGNYTCEASLVSDHNEKISYTTKLEIIDLQTPEIISNDKNITVMIGQKLEASCKANGIPKPNVTWQFKAENSNAFTDIPSQGELVTIPSISYEGAGVYKCKATNDVGSQSRIHNVVVHGAPKITNPNDVYSGVTGDKVLLIPCEVSSVPEPSIIWKHEGKRIMSDEKLTINKNKLFINNPTEKDNANFTCEAKNKYGNAIKNFSAELSDFIDFDENLNTYIYLKIGESRDIKCNLPHSDPRSVRWYINMDKHFERASSYSIRDAKYSNDGNYTCRVNTDQGSKSLNYVVDVGNKPSFIIPSSSPIVSWNGNKNEILNCDVDAKPREKVIWLHNGKPLDSAVTELYISGYGWGEYTCIVSNVHGSVQQTFNVTSTGCVIDTTVNRVKNTPLLIGDQPLTWPKFYRENEYIVVKHKDNLTLTCSTEDQPRNTFKINKNAKEISMECYKEDKFTVEGKIYKFQDLECENYVRTSLISTKEPCLKNGELKKVGFKLSNGILGVYDICYSDADHRILYTKVLMSDANLGNKVGPSFQLNQGIKTSKRVDDLLKCQYNQRRFVSPKDVAFGPAQISTLENKYNLVLVYEPCEDSSRMSWSDIEEMYQSILENVMYNFTLWTVAIQNDANGRPRYLWKLAKVDDEYEAIVYVNAPNPDRSDILCSTHTSNIFSLPDTEKYTYSCAIEELLEAFKLTLNDFGILKSIQ